jgi:hypothetical protein
MAVADVGAGSIPTAQPVDSDHDVERTETVELTVLMPCLNEAETVATCVRSARRFLDEHGLRGEVLIADNGSTDGSQRLAEQAGARVLTVRERGYGNALINGIAAARGTFVVAGDADDSYDFQALGPFLDELRAGADLVMGDRFAGGIAPGAMPALHRYLGNPVLSAIGRLLFHSPVRDFHCGLRGMRRSAMLALDLQAPGMEFASEMVVRATLAGLRVTQVPTTLRPDGRSRPPHLQSWSDGWRHLRFLLLYSPRWLFLIPGLTAMLLGLVFGGLIVAAPLRIAGVSLDVASLVIASAMVVTGFQAVQFAVFSKASAMSKGYLPPDPRIVRLMRVVTLGRALLAGGALALAGLVGLFISLRYWQSRGYGTLDPEHVLRLVIPSATALMLGSQTILGGAFLSILGISPGRSPRPPDADAT